MKNGCYKEYYDNDVSKIGYEYYYLNDQRYRDVINGPAVICYDESVNDRNVM